MSDLTDLLLSLTMEGLANDLSRVENETAWYVRRYTRCLKVTEDIAKACPRLQGCNWVEDVFVVVEEKRDSKTVRVVRGVKQGWMDKNHCKLEDLPGDIVDL